MRILMLGNSFTTANHMPDMLDELTGAEIVQHTRGGERLADQLNPKTKMGKRTQEALQNEKWDFEYEQGEIYDFIIKFITSEKKFQHTKVLKTIPEIAQYYWAHA